MYGIGLIGQPCGNEVHKSSKLVSSMIVVSTENILGYIYIDRLFFHKLKNRIP